MNARPSSSHVRRLAPAAALVLFCAGCASPYWQNRCADAADVFTATVGVGLGATARIGPLHAGLGANWDFYGIEAGEIGKLGSLGEAITGIGDKAADDKVFVPTPGGHAHTTDLIGQVRRFNDGFFADGTPIKHPGTPFSFGVACYPEKHEEAPNLERDMEYLKMKQNLGAQYAVTQLFFDNEKYFQFVEKARQMGITIPIVPGIKPMAKLSQLTVVPKTFHCDIPEALAKEIAKCTTDEEARHLGIEWTTQQCKELYEHGIKNIHFYTVSAVDSVVEVAKRLL